MDNADRSHDIRECKTLDELVQLLASCIDQPFAGIFDGDTPLDTFECEAIARVLFRLAPSPSEESGE